MRGSKARTTTVFRRRIAGIEKDRADERFANVGEDCDLIAGAGLPLAFAKPDVSLDAPFARDFGAALAAHEIGEPARQFPLFGIGKAHVEHFRDDEAENAVAEKFEPLISFAPAVRGADMGQRQDERDRDWRTYARCCASSGSEIARSFGAIISRV